MFARFAQTDSLRPIMLGRCVALRRHGQGVRPHVSLRNQAKARLNNSSPIMTMNSSFVIAVLACSSVWLAAAPASFDFKDPKGVNNARFNLDAPLEAISGSANGVAGTILFDPADPSSAKGKITVATSSLRVPNSMMQDHMLGEKWLDASKHPEISFEAKQLKNVKTSGDTTLADVTGIFTLKGVSKEITVPAKFTYLKDKLSQRVPNQKGDLLVVRADFSIKRSDFNINPGQGEDKVADKIELALSIAGAAPEKANAAAR